MANPEHEAILAQGLVAWVRWREENPEIQPDLSGTSFFHMQHAHMRQHEMKIQKMHFYRISFSHFDFTHADLSGANLSRYDFSDCSFYKANLSGANLFKTHLRGANLRYAKFDNAVCGLTGFVDVDLSLSTGLDQIIHYGMSNLDIETLVRSKGRIAEAFLRGCGVPENMVALIPSLMAEAASNPFCQIIYHTEDLAFAQRLDDSLKAIGIRSWMYERTYSAGNKERQSAAGSMYGTFDQLIICCSQHVLESSWFDLNSQFGLTYPYDLSDSNRQLIVLDLDGSLNDLQEPQPLVDQLKQKIVQPYKDWKDVDTFDESFEYLVGRLRTYGDEPIPS